MAEAWKSSGAAQCTGETRNSRNLGQNIACFHEGEKEQTTQGGVNIFVWNRVRGRGRNEGKVN